MPNGAARIAGERSRRSPDYPRFRTVTPDKPGRKFAVPDHLRFSVIGTSGSGKTTLGRALAARLKIPFVELDSIIHQADWVALPEAEFRARVAAVVEGERWVIDGNYHVVRDLVWDRATTIVWLDLPRPQIMARVIWRSVSRAATGAELWSGNRERWRALLDRDHPIRWAWRTFRERRQRYESLRDARWVRLRSRREMQRWLDEVAREGKG
jgi:adenylate kinase family enzyme